MIDPVDAVNLETAYECRAHVPSSKLKALDQSNPREVEIEITGYCKQGENPK